jgi:hypothetical protein
MGRWMKIEQKRAVIRKAKAHPAMSQEALAERRHASTCQYADLVSPLINFNETSPFQNKCFALGVGSASTHCNEVELTMTETTPQ